MTKRVFAQETISEEQQQQNEKSLATKTQVDSLQNQIDANIDQVGLTIDQLVRFLRFLTVDPQYASPENFQQAQTFMQRMEEIQGFLSGGATENIQSLGPLEMPPSPSEDNANAKTNYSNVQMFYERLKSQLGRLLPLMKQVSQLIEQAQNGQEEWAIDPAYAVKKTSYENIITRAKDLGLTNIIASTKRRAVLGICPKCSYGFAGKKPQGEYDPTKPCPSCGMVQVPTAGGEKVDEQGGFGEKYYVSIDNNDLGYVGPFYSTADAEEMKEEIEDLNAQEGKWSGNFYESGAKVISERAMYDKEAKRSQKMVDLAKERGMDPEIIEVWSKADPTITSPSDARKSYKTTIDFFKDRYFEKQKPKGPNTASKKEAYPTSFHFKPHPKPVNTKKWKTIATQINTFKRAYPEYTFPQVLYHFTKGWDMFDRYKFKNWFKWNYRIAGANKMEKKANADVVMQDRLQKFEKKRKLLLSRIDLVRKALRDLMNNSLIDKQSSSKIFRLLSMLEHEAMDISSPKIAAARTRRTVRQLEKLGFSEGSSILKTAAEQMLAPEPGFVKTAKETMDMERTTRLLKDIKDEMNKLSYTKHLDALYHMKKELEEMGRGSDAESILKIIRDDLDALDKLNKKLTDVYTNLSRVPIELTEEQDKKLTNNEEPGKAEDDILEVEEVDEVDEEPKLDLGEPEIEMTEVPEAPKAPKEGPRMPRRPAPAPAARPAPRVPNVETEIPNV